MEGMRKKNISFCSYDKETTYKIYGVYYTSLYPVPGTWYMIPDVYTAAVLVQSEVSIEPPQHRPSARAASARAALSTPSERRDRTQMPSVHGESRETCRLNNTASQQQTAVVYRST